MSFFMAGDFSFILQQSSREECDFMERKHGVWILIFILLFLIANFIYSLIMLVDYEQRKDSGNDRWKQVEDRILRIEDKVEAIEDGAAS